MKKFMLCTLLLGAFTFSACGSDDDGGGAQAYDTCQICTDANSETAEFCLKEDGSIVQIILGQEIDVDAGGQTFEEFIAFRISVVGGTCEAK